jgi:hypothetical protein
MCGGSNPISAITDPISSAIGTDGGGGGVLGALADIDPGPAIGSGLAEVDDFVNDEIPGGWALPAALAVAYATGYIDPSLFATEAAATAAAEAGAGAIATEVGQAAFFEALAAGATSAEAVSAGLGAEALAAGSAGFFTPELMGPTYGELGLTGLEGGLAGPTYGELGLTGVEGSYITPELMGPTYGELGVTGVPEGGMGPTYGELGYTGLNNAEAIAAADAAAYAAANNITLKDAYNALSKANAVKNLAMSGYNLATGKGVPRPSSGSTNLLSRTNSGNISADLAGGPQNITADLTKGNTSFSLNDFGGAANNPQLFNTGTNPAAYTPPAPTQPAATRSFNEGGGVEGHNPTFFSPGGLASIENTYVKGEGDGTSDSVAAMLANGEFVIPADVVSKLGNGSNDAGANVLDEFLSTIREHAQRHNPKELPPDSKGPLAYLAEANKKARA